PPRPSPRRRRQPWMETLLDRCLLLTGYDPAPTSYLVGWAVLGGLPCLFIEQRHDRPLEHLPDPGSQPAPADSSPRCPAPGKRFFSPCPETKRRKKRVAVQIGGDSVRQKGLAIKKTAGP